MTSINSLKKHLINIAIFNSYLTYDIYDDIRFHQLIDMNNNIDKKYSYTYGLYCDDSMIKSNIFLPILHTIYLGSKKNAVIIKNYEDIWLKELFPNNNFYVISDKKDDFDYAEESITKINNIKDILEFNHEEL